MTIRVSDYEARRFSEFMQQPKFANKWALIDTIKRAMDYALSPKMGLDEMYECDKLGCVNRVVSPGTLCETHDYVRQPITGNQLAGVSQDQKP